MEMNAYIYVHALDSDLIEPAIPNAINISGAILEKRPDWDLFQYILKRKRSQGINYAFILSIYLINIKHVLH